MILALIASVFYLTYRALFTLNLDGYFAASTSLSLFLAECYGCFLMSMYFFQIWVVKNPDPKPPLEGRTVDVFIPTYNEDPDLLRGTISAALKIDYPHRTLVLDDGKRPEVKALCEELGAEYMTRGSNIHAKAGNLNHALDQTDGEFLIIFDADHVSERHFIDRLIGYFEDERLGFVQTPHSFYNFDAYQGLLNYKAGTYWEEGMLFYNVTQPGKNHWDAVSFCGSAAMFRREALVDVGLVAVESITEDMHTGIRMHAKGWGSLFVNERLITAQAAPDITSFNTQRLRWGEGNLGVMGFDNPLTMRGLTLAQRICYLGSMLSWTTGVQKLIIYCAPIIMLFTGVPPVVNLSWTLAAVTMTYLMIVWSSVKICSNGYGNLIGIELTQMACFWTQTKATWRAIFNRKTANFVVTSKRGRQSNSVIKEIRPQIAYLVASAAAIAWASSRYAMGITNDFAGLSIGFVLLIVHSWLAWVVIRRAMRPGSHRYSWRHPAAIPATVSVQLSDGEKVHLPAMTRDINERGVGLVCYRELPPIDAVQVTMGIGERTVTCYGDIRWRRTMVNYRSRRDGQTQAFGYGVEFFGLDTEMLATLWWLGAQYAVARQYEKFKGGQFGLDPSTVHRISTSTSEKSFELPVSITPWGEPSYICSTESIGPESLVVLLGSEYPAQQAFEVTVEMPFGQVHAWGTCEEHVVRMIGGEQLFETRIRLIKYEDEARGRLKSLEGHGTTRDILPSVKLQPKAARLPIVRPTAIASSAITLAAGIVVAVAVVVEKDEAIIAKVNRGEIPVDTHVERLDNMVERIRVAEKVDEEQVLRLRSAMMKLEHEEEVDVLDEVLAKHSTMSTEGQILKAISLHNLGRYDEAETIFVDLVARFDDSQDKEMLLAAARNANSLGENEIAFSRFETLREAGFTAPEERLEYAGTASRAGHGELAIEVLSVPTATPDHRHLLGSLHAAESRFDDAIAVYQSLVNDFPNDRKARRGLADNNLWAGNSHEAVVNYRLLLAGNNFARDLRDRYAEALLADRQYDEGLHLFATLLSDARSEDTRTASNDPPSDTHSDIRPNTTSVRQYEMGYLACIANASTLRPHDVERLRHIIDTRHEHSNDAEYTVRLLHAASRLNDTKAILPLLEALVAAEPANNTLRLRLADALQDLGKHREAEAHYTWLVQQTQALVEQPQRTQISR